MQETRVENNLMPGTTSYRTPHTVMSLLHTAHIMSHRTAHIMSHRTAHIMSHRTAHMSHRTAQLMSHRTT